MVAIARDQFDSRLNLLPDEVWRDAAAFLGRVVEPGDILLAPNDYIHVFRGTIALHVTRAMIPGVSIDFYVFHKGMLNHVDVELLREAVSLTPLYADEVFAVYGRRGEMLSPDRAHHLDTVRDHLAQRDTTSVERFIAAVVPTYSRAWALRRMLRSLVPQCRHIVVVDDGSPAWCAIRNRLTAKASGATYIRLPRRSGKATALNVGILFWLAQERAEWISTFDDDTELADGALETLTRVASTAAYSRDSVTFSGYQSPHHSNHEQTTIAGHPVLIARSCSGQHIHAHRSLWQRVLPIPTAYPKAPKEDIGVFSGHGCDTDWWVSNWCPNSAVKSGGDIVIIPGLVSTFGVGHSTWGGPGD